MPGNDNNATAPAATGASKMLAMLPKITKWVTSGDANALSSRNRSSWRAARINFIMALTALSFWNVLLKIGEKADPPVGDLVVVDGLGAPPVAEGTGARVAIPWRLRDALPKPRQHGQDSLSFFRFQFSKLRLRA